MSKKQAMINALIDTVQRTTDMENVYNDTLQCDHPYHCFEWSEIMTLRNYEPDTELEIEKLKEEVRLLESHIQTVDEFYVPEVKTTGIAKPANGYVVLTHGCDAWSVFTSLEELVADQVEQPFNAHIFDKCASVYELGQKIQPVSTVTWEDVK